MSRPDFHRLGRKLVVLALLITGLGFVASDDGSRAANAAAAPLICCSACDVENPPRPCRFGCSPSC